MTTPLEPLAVTIPDACRLSGLGRTKIYSLIEQEKLETTKIGRRRLVRFASLKALLDA